MAGRYERINTRDAENPETPVTPASATVPHPSHTMPNSPPPSFHSRSSTESQERHRLVDPTLADAFDADGPDDDEEDDDDRQRLVRGIALPLSGGSGQSDTTAEPSNFRPVPLPRQVTELPNFAATSGARVYGAGIQADGVFSNLSAKPDRGESEKEEQPPTYEQAAADAAPPYWETTILAPGLAGPDEVYIDGMPVGSVFSFAWNGMISIAFQLPGFLLTYLLHSTHAAKNGSRAGLGVNLIQYGFYMKTASGGGGGGGSSGPSDAYAEPPNPNAHDFDPNSVGTSSGSGGRTTTLADIASSEWLAYVLMIVGWIILIRSLHDYLRARRHEQLVLQSPDRGLGVAIVAEGEHPEQVV